MQPNYPNWLQVKQCKKVFTKDVNGNDNGFLVDILNKNDEIFSSRQDEAFQQVYYSSVYRNMFKGFHIHPHKLDTVHCLLGDALLVVYPHVVLKENIGMPIELEDLILIPFNDSDNCLTITFPSKYPHGYFGMSEIAYILNYRNPAWNPNDLYQYDLKVAGIEDILLQKFNALCK